MQDEITESTVLVKHKKRGPSFWVNVGTLVFLAAVIAAAQKMSEKWIEPTPPPFPEEAMENHIVLEDLETEKPLAESESVAVPSIAEPARKKSEIRNPKSSAKGGPASGGEIQKSKTKQAAPLDPYTSGGAMDLDRPENREKYFPGRPKSGFIKKRVPATRQPQAEAQALPLFPSERDRFIPFEKE